MIYTIIEGKKGYYTFEAFYNNELVNKLTVFTNNKNKKFNQFKEDFKIKLKKLKKKKELVIMLKIINDKDYLTIPELQTVLNSFNKLYYRYDLMGVGEISRTEKGIKLIDILNDAYYIYDKDYKFYKDLIEL